VVSNLSDEPLEAMISYLDESMARRAAGVDAKLS
jgi:hypothetical protein